VTPRNPSMPSERCKMIIKIQIIKLTTAAQMASAVASALMRSIPWHACAIHTAELSVNAAFLHRQALSVGSHPPRSALVRQVRAHSVCASSQ
jgi:hypothetical protein